MNAKSSHDGCKRAMSKPFRTRWSPELARSVADHVVATYEDEKGINHIDGLNMPQREVVLGVLEILLEILFPGYTGKHEFHRTSLDFAIGGHVDFVFRTLSEQVERALVYRCRMQCCEGCDCFRMAEDAVIALLEKLPAIREILKTDVQAAYDGDPAAKSNDEIVIAYPGLHAIAIQRVAHELNAADIPLIPRVMGEHAHTVTGIDIHPGAEIGPSFFIDHGTGVVIGETAVIGTNVKLYQGVTLGALSFPKDENGNPIKGVKRHPNIEDNVTIYSGATLLGDITIGHDSIVGGNVWLTESVPPRTKVTIPSPELTIRSRGKAKPDNA